MPFKPSPEPLVGALLKFSGSNEASLSICCRVDMVARWTSGKQRGNKVTAEEFKLRGAHKWPGCGSKWPETDCDGMQA